MPSTRSSPHASNQNLDPVTDTRFLTSALVGPRAEQQDHRRSCVFHEITPSSVPDCARPATCSPVPPILEVRSRRSLPPPSSSPRSTESHCRHGSPPRQARLSRPHQWTGLPRSGSCYPPKPEPKPFTPGSSPPRLRTHPHPENSMKWGFLERVSWQRESLLASSDAISSRG